MARLINPFDQYFDGAGDPLVKGKLWFYASGSSTIAKDTYADAAENITNTNPVILTGDGRAPNVFGPGQYRVILTDKDDVQILQRDPVGGIDSLPFGADWVSYQRYGVSDVVRDDGKYWKSLIGNNQNNRPSTDGGVRWERVVYNALEINGISGTTVANKAGALLLDPAEHPALFISGTDGGTFYADTGKAPGTYTDNGGAYCGTVIVPTGGDGSAAFLSDPSETLDVRKFGAIDDGGVTDVTSEINAALTVWKNDSSITKIKMIGTFKVTNLQISGVVNKKIEADCLLIGTSTTTAAALLDFLDCQGVHVAGRLTINGLNNQGYARAIWWRGSPGQSAQFLKMDMIGISRFLIGVEVGSSDNQNGVVSENHIEMLTTYETITALKCTGEQAYIHVSDSQLLGDNNETTGGWDLLTGNTVIAQAGHVHINNCGVVKAATTTGGTFELDTLTGATGGYHGRITVNNSQIESAAVLLKTSNSGAFATPKEGHFNMANSGGWTNFDNTAAWLTTEDHYHGKISIKQCEFYAASTRFVPHCSFGTSTRVYMDDQSFGTAFLQGLQGIKGGIIKFDAKSIIYASNISQSFTSGVGVVPIFTAQKNSFDTNRFNGTAFATIAGANPKVYDETTGEITIPSGGFKCMQVHAHLKLSTLPLTGYMNFEVSTDGGSVWTPLHRDDISSGYIMMDMNIDYPPAANMYRFRVVNTAATATETSTFESVLSIIASA